ncbi:uncharacterized protein LOC127749675 [Frankliniella occidentalis]|uniref:Uncharacterized protein LOC127749675 n=1 Tax=Frankliniella occidentalis TaxID=133901 RepID=A0A9C6WYU1_FRAOC|nr:uncharacterized protein LOC127749675 [Frankliniella occidentalis]
MDVVRYTRKAIHAGHMYTKHRQVKLGIAWRCDQRGACLGRIVVDQHDKVVTAADHTHGPDWGRCKAAECVQDIKQAAGTSRASTTSVIQPKVARVSTETTTKLPKNAALRKMVRRVKRQHLPPEPKSLDELDNIPRRFHVTLKGDRWLLYYEPEDEERMLVFSSNHHLKLLQRATYWVMDGTFKSAPKIVCQIYAIHGCVNGKWVPLVIALLENKTRRTYEKLFDVLKTEVRRRLRKDLQPEYVSTDYEQGAISAVRTAFPDAELCACLFHLGQTFFRQVQAAGLAIVYRAEESEGMRADFHALIAIAFVPVDDVEDAFDALQEVSDPALRPVFQHVEDHYVRGRLQARRRGGRVRQRGRPMFPPALWNCYSRAEQGLPRTTNTCEAWHRRLGTLVGKNHPSLYVFLDQLQEVAVIDVECSRAEAGHSPQKRRAQCEVTDARVARIQARYEEYREADDVLSYLRAIGANVAGNL